MNKFNNIICIGDSLTFGYGVHQNKSWVSLLKENCNHNVINKGVNGDTSTGILSRFDRDVLKYNTKICIIMCGTNDLLCGREVNSIIDNINIMIKDCLYNDIIPIIISPPRILDKLAKKLWESSLNYNYINEKLNLFNKELCLLCQKNNISFLSIYDLISYNESYYTDGIHLTESANILIFNAVNKILTLNTL